MKDWQMNPAENLHGGHHCDSTGYYDGMYIVCEGNAVFTQRYKWLLTMLAVIVSSGDTLLVEGICDHAGSRMSQTRAIARSKKSGKVVATANGSYIMNTKQ